MEFNESSETSDTPKLNRRIISSSSIRTAVGKIVPRPILNRARFLKPRPIRNPRLLELDRSRFSRQSPENPGLLNANETENENLDLSQFKKETVERLNNIQKDLTLTKKSFLDSLVETNKSLDLIRKQLELDYSNRIKEDKESVKKIKFDREKSRRFSKEKSIETASKIGGKLGGILGVVTKPVKNIFGKIAEFFSILLEGFIVNNVFNWLSKKENRQALSNTIDFLIKNWKIIAGIIVGGLALRALYKVVKLVNTVKNVLRFLRILPKKGPGSSLTTTTSRGGILRNASGVRRGFTTETSTLRGSDRYYGAGKSGLLELNRKFSGSPVQQYTRTKTPIAKAVQGIGVGFKMVGSDIMKSIGMGPGAKGIFKLLRPIFKKIPFIGGLLDFALSLAMGESVGRSAAKAAGAMLGSALGSFPPLIPFGGPIWGGIVGDLIAGGIYDALTKNKDAKEGEKERDIPKLSLGGKIKGPSHAAGGVLIEAEGGEFIVKKQEVPKYEPILKDINENGGRLWEEFIAGVRKQKDINDMSIKTVNEFETVLGKYKEILEKEEERLKNRSFLPMGGGEMRGKLNMSSTKEISESNKMKNLDKSTNSKKLEKKMMDSIRKQSANTMNISETIQSNVILPTVYIPFLAPIPTESPNLSPVKTGPTIINLPPEIIDQGVDPSSIKIPLSRKESKRYPKILSYDASNEYLDRSIFEYDIEGIRFGG